ncbi:MAG: hypothetical protein H7X80_03865, partial [bacterium]|nr:hypothetical protein [Candidatus Kapabacteria bacterium]
MYRLLRLFLAAVFVFGASAHAFAQVPFLVSVANKTAAHPYFNTGHNEGY